MSGRDTVLRSIHDLGLAAWFGGSLMGAVGLNGAAESEGGSTTGTARTASAGWAKWTPVNAAAIGVHLIGGTGVLSATRHGSSTSREWPRRSRPRPSAPGFSNGQTKK